MPITFPHLEGHVLSPDPPLDPPLPGQPEPLAARILAFGAQIQAQRDAQLATEASKEEERTVTVIDAPPTPRSGLEHGVADFLSARRAFSQLGESPTDTPPEFPSGESFAEGTALLPQSDAPTDELTTIHDLLGSVRTTRRVHLRTEDMTTLSILLAWWVYQHDDDASEIPHTYRQAARAMGREWYGDFAKHWRDSLVRLDAWRAEISEEMKDGSERWETIGFFHYVRGHEHPDERDAGHIVVGLHRRLLEELRARRLALFPLQCYLQLRADLSKELYRFVETQRGFGPNGDYSIVITPGLLASLGCRQAEPRQARYRLRRALEEIIKADPRYVDAGIRRGKTKGQHVLWLRRQRLVDRVPLLPRPAATSAPALRTGARSA